MNQDQLFKEIQSHMPRFEDVWYKRTEDIMEVYIADTKEFFVDKGGYAEWYNNENGDEHYYEVRNCLNSATALVREYDKAMKKAPDLKVPDLPQSYKLLAQYDNIVLAGRELSNESFEFVTWRQNNNGVGEGNYYGNNYARAKEDFATRSGLVNESKVFSDKEYVEMYRCVCDTLEGDYELNDEHREMLENLCRRIPEAVDNFEQMLKESQSQGYEITMGG